MNKTIIMILIMLMNSFFTHADLDNSFYLGGKLGMSQFKNAHNSQLLNLAMSKQNNLSLGAFAGYQANDYFALEVGYDWLGKSKYHNNNNQHLGNLNSQGMSLSSKLDLPLNRLFDSLTIYGKAGLFFSYSKWESNEQSSAKFNVSPLFSAGMDYQFNANLSTRIEYQWTKISHNDYVGDMNNHLVTLGLIYHFNAKQKVNDIPFIEIYPHVERSYELNSNVLFAFDQYHLTALGENNLQKLVLELKESNLVNKQIVIVGHTDSIGSQGYNDRLSEKRANTVMNALINKGLLAEKISAYGVGMTQPITGDECLALTGQQRKSCLSPDRRVTIEVRAKYSYQPALF